MNSSGGLEIQQKFVKCVVEDSSGENLGARVVSPEGEGCGRCASMWDPHQAQRCPPVKGMQGSPG